MSMPITESTTDIESQDPVPEETESQEEFTDGEEEGYEDDEEEEEDTSGAADTGPRFDVIESFFLISVNLLGDALELLDLTGIGVIAGVIVDFINGPLTVGYLFIKGVPRAIGKNTLAQGIEFIPGLDILPIRTTVIILTILQTNHPGKFGFLKKLSGKKRLKGE